MAGRHTRVDGDARLQEMKAQRAAEVEALRESDPALAAIIPKGWVRRQVGFPPYFQMFEGAMFRAQIMLRDERDVKRNGDVFVRYHLKLIAPDGIECRLGPSDDRGEPVAVHAGEIFTIGSYTQIAGELNGLMGLEAAIVCRKERNLEPDPETGDPRTMYDFDVLVDPETERMLLSESSKDREFMRGKYAEARRLAMENSIKFMFEPKESKSKKNGTRSEAAV